MFDENQLVEVKCHPKTRKHYELNGYKYTKMGDAILVKAKDLTENSHVRVKVICDFCGEPYYPEMVNYNNRENKEFDACNNCRTLKSSVSTLKQRTKECFKVIKEICKQNDYILLTDESEYKNIYTPISYICKKHGKKCISAGMMIEGCGCKECGYEKNAINRTLTPEHIKEEIEKFNENKLINPEDYVGAKVRNLKILCNCGEIYTTSFNDYSSRDTAKRCSKCNGKISNGEYKINNILINYSINFVAQKVFENCRDKKPLPFDFYLPDYNLAIEYDGKQHYEPVEYFGGENGFKYTIHHDKIKNKYCKDNGIKLLRISYMEYDNIENIIIKELNL